MVLTPWCIRLFWLYRVVKIKPNAVFLKITSTNPLAERDFKGLEGKFIEKTIGLLAETAFFKATTSKKHLLRMLSFQTRLLRPM
jgi:hypothetical protein